MWPPMESRLPCQGTSVCPAIGGIAGGGGGGGGFDGVLRWQRRHSIDMHTRRSSSKRSCQSCSAVTHKAVADVCSNFRDLLGGGGTPLRLFTAGPGAQVMLPRSSTQVSARYRPPAAMQHAHLLEALRLASKVYGSRWRPTSVLHLHAVVPHGTSNECMLSHFLWQIARDLRSKKSNNQSSTAVAADEVHAAAVLRKRDGVLIPSARSSAAADCRRSPRTCL